MAGDVGLAQMPRLAAQLSVRGGWERAVETALGDYLEALCVDELDAIADVLPSLSVGRISLLQAGEHVEADNAEGLLSRVVSGPRAIVRLLSGVRLAESLAEALKLRRELAHDQSVITRSGEWIGRGLVARQSRRRPAFRVLEREQRLKQQRAELGRSEENTRVMEAQLVACREELATAERDRDAAQGRIQGAHRDHADLLGQLEGERARAQESTVRRERLEEEARRSRVKPDSHRTPWRAPVRCSTAVWSRSTRWIRAVWGSKPNAKNDARHCKRRAPTRRRRSSPAATADPY